jgi:hypothetical protein
MFRWPVPGEMWNLGLGQRRGSVIKSGNDLWNGSTGDVGILREFEERLDQLK